ncbi:MAG: hypothetical protein ACFFDI_31285 [Promethearchaeota archaeon]
MALTMNKLLKAIAFGPIIYASDTKGKISISLNIPPVRQDIIQRIVSGKSRGLSPEIKVKKWECSICHDDYEKCIHKSGEKYDEAECCLIARDIEFTGESIVDVPRDPRCRITDLLLVKAVNGNRKKFEWYGFELNADSDRFENIQSALKHKLIPQKAAFRFSEFFSINLLGKCVYP